MAQTNKEQGSEKPFKLRPMQAGDLEAAANVCFKAFNTFNKLVHIPPEFEHIAETIGAYSSYATEGVYGFVITDKKDGKVLGANLIDCRDPTAMIGPIAVATVRQSKGGGRALMEAVISTAKKLNMKRIRLCANLSNPISFSLYVKLGFNPHFSCGEYVGILKPSNPTYTSLRNLYKMANLKTEKQFSECDELHKLLCGITRLHNITSDSKAPWPSILLRDEKGQVVAYSTGMATVTSHSLAVDLKAFQALVACMSSKLLDLEKKPGHGWKKKELRVQFHVPHCSPQVIRWVMQNGFKLTRQIVAMGSGSEDSSFVHPAVVNKGIVYLNSIDY
ncbi:hypothetical protein AAMO2058_000366500 [Amorphochlora amoebiformis]